MRAAAAVNENDISVIIPESLETASGILIIETETMQAVRYAVRGWAGVMEEEDVEFLVCGRIYNSNLFEKIAQNGISRYYAGGMLARDAIVSALKHLLPAITDYEGGCGCGSGKDECYGHILH